MLRYLNTFKYYENIIKMEPIEFREYYLIYNLYLDLMLSKSFIV